MQPLHTDSARTVQLASANVPRRLNNFHVPTVLTISLPHALRQQFVGQRMQLNAICSPVDEVLRTCATGELLYTALERQRWRVPEGR